VLAINMGRSYAMLKANRSAAPMDWALVIGDWAIPIWALAIAHSPFGIQHSAFTRPMCVDGIDPSHKRTPRAWALPARASNRPEYDR
jgi:hypothetical protein